MNALQLALRLLRRDWRSGELRLLALALLIAVGSVSTVGFFTERVEKAMTRQAGEVLAADLTIESGQSLPQTLVDEAARRGLRHSRLVEFPSVLLVDGRSQLVQVKAVDEAYPLRGQLRADSQQPLPPPGQVWIEPRLTRLLPLAVGERLRLGRSEPRIEALIRHEPDRAINLFRLAPRVLMRLSELPATGLLGPASRAKYRLLLAGPAATIDRYQRWLEDHLPAGARVAGVRSARPELRNALDRAGRFLRLTAITAVLLGMVAVAIATRRFVQRQTDASALLRCLGASRAQVLAVFAWRLLLLGLLASGLGALLGLAAQGLLVMLISDWFSEPLPAAGLLPLASSLVTGLLVLLGVALPPLLRLGQVPPLRVFRRELEAPPLAQWTLFASSGLALLALLLMQIGGDALALRLVLGLVAALLILLGVSRLLVLGIGRLRRASAGGWRYGLAALARRPVSSAIQLTGFGLAITALLLLTLVRSDLLHSWREALPEKAPNQFLINIQPHEVEPLASLLAERGIERHGPYPMIRGRLVRIGDRPVDPQGYSNPRAQRLAAREFNLSHAAEPQPDNRIVAGRWWGPQGLSRAEFSVEQGIAETLGIQLGDTLEYVVAGQSVVGRVTSLRTVQWDSFHPNFFVVGTPGLMAELPATSITSFYLPPERQGLIAELVQRFPSITPLDVSALIGQVRSIMDRGAQAIEAVFGFTLASGLVVLLAGIQAGRDLRAQEAAVLRTLGLSSAKLRQALLIEYGLLGGLAGLIGALFASLIGAVLAESVFGLSWQFNPLIWLIGVGCGSAGIALAGLAANRTLIRQPPASVLRLAS